MPIKAEKLFEIDPNAGAGCGGCEKPSSFGDVLGIIIDRAMSRGCSPSEISDLCDCFTREFHDLWADDE